MTKFHSDMSWRLGVDDRNFKRGARRVENRVKKLSSTFKGVASGLGAAFGAAGLGFALLDAGKKVIAFEQVMAKVKALTGATGAEFQTLSKDAKRLGASTRFTATEVGQLQLEFSKLGFSTKEILKATEATLQLATATGEDLAQAATVAGATVRAFGLETKDTQRVVDVMAQSFTTSALNLEKFETAMASVAPVARAANASLERTTAILQVVVNRGVDASSAGTALRNIFLELAKQGLTWNEAMGQIRDSTNQNATALDLFGKRGATVATIIAGATDEINDFEKGNINAAGSAKKMADIVDDTTEGALKRLVSAYDGLILKLSAKGGVNDSFKEFIESLTGSITTFDNSIDRVGKLKEAWSGLALEIVASNRRLGEFLNVLSIIGGKGNVTQGGFKRTNTRQTFFGFDLDAYLDPGLLQGLPGKSATFPFPSGRDGVGVFDGDAGGGGGGGGVFDPLDRVFAKAIAPAIQYREVLRSITPVLDGINIATEDLRSGSVESWNQIDEALLETAQIGFSVGSIFGNMAGDIATSFGSVENILKNFALSMIKKLIAITVAALAARVALSFIPGIRGADKAVKEALSLGQIFKQGIAGSLPSFAEGGIVTGPTLAMIGDNPGGREAVIPLNGNNGLNVNVVGILKGRDIYLANAREVDAIFRGT